MSAHLDGDGWVRCRDGHAHWGRHGAAGLLLQSRSSEGVPVVMLQQRAPWTHHGGTWGVPGGARASWESPEQAAVRETGEEVDALLEGLTVRHVHHDDHGDWAYWTVIAEIAVPMPVAPRNQESTSIAWLPVAEVATLELHPGFALTWPVVSLSLLP